MAREMTIRGMLKTALDLMRENNARLRAIERRLDMLETSDHTTTARMGQIQHEVDVLKQRRPRVPV